MTRWTIGRRAKIGRGITLIELLVVISIILLLAVVALPALAPSRQGRRVREAARAIAAFLGTARAQAMATGRPVAVAFPAITSLPTASAALLQMEQPLPYGGELTTSTARFRVLVNGPIPNPPPPPRTAQQYYTHCVSPVVLVARVPTASVTSLSYFLGAQNRAMSLGGNLDGIVLPTMQIDYRGPKYPVVGWTQSTTSDYDIYLSISASYWPYWPDDSSKSIYPKRPDASTPPDPHTFSPPNLPVLPFPRFDPANKWDVDHDATTWSDPLPYLIFPVPVSSATPPLELPTSVVIDLQWSGRDSHNYNASGGGINSNNVGNSRITFLPNGEVDDIFDPMYLLVGQRDRVMVPASPSLANEFPNWWLSTNLWVVVEPRTGLIRVAENYQISDDEWAVLNKGGFRWDKWNTWNAAIQLSRVNARGAAIQGGDDAMEGK